MRIFNSIEEYAKTGYQSRVALGFFDGVHLGHRAVIHEIVADKGGDRAVVLTFRESPAKLLSEEDVPLITDNRRKAELLDELGVDAVIFADFGQIKETEAEDFVRGVLARQLRAKKVSCGYNYRFGKGGKGDIATLEKLCGELGIGLSVCQPVDCGGQAVSSSAVRELLQCGKIADANRMLGSAYSVRGRIDSGNHIGTTMGFPTVNLAIEKGLIVPKRGVYASRVTIGSECYRGATNIGVHPTVGENDTPLCETFLLDYRGEELRGEYAVCEPVAFIRDEKKFASVDALTEQISKDIEAIKKVMDAGMQ